MWLRDSRVAKTRSRWMGRRRWRLIIPAGSGRNQRQFRTAKIAEGYIEIVAVVCQPGGALNLRQFALEGGDETGARGRPVPLAGVHDSIDDRWMGRGWYPHSGQG